jgi:hypothetical protein
MRRALEADGFIFIAAGDPSRSGGEGVRFALA